MSWQMFIILILRTQTVIVASTCPQNGVYYSVLDYCYWFLPDLRKISEQKAVCAQDGGSLAVVPDSNAHQFIEDNLGTDMLNKNEYVLIDFEKGLYWITEGEVLQTYFNWDTNEPSNTVNYVVLDPTSGFKWKSSHIFGIPFVIPTPYFTALCYKDFILSVGCPASSFYYQPYCYWYDSTSRKYSDHVTSCAADGGKLAIIPDQFAQNFIENQFGASMVSDGSHVLTGIYRSYTWSPSSWTNWDIANGQPDGGSMTVIDPSRSFQWRDIYTTLICLPCPTYSALCYKVPSSITIVAALTETTTNVVTESTTETSTETQTPDETTTNVVTEPTADSIESTTKLSTELNTTTGIQSLITTDSEQTSTTESKQSTNPTSTNIDATNVPISSHVSSASPPVVSSPTCMCSCSILPPSLQTPNSSVVSIDMIQEEIKEIKSQLVIDEKATSTSQRKLKSATDTRTSSRSIGGVGIFFLTIVFGGIMLPDLHRVYLFIRG